MNFTPSKRDAASALWTPPILTHAGPLLARYDAIFCDVWGVVHDGLRAFAAAGDALARFRARGGTVVLVTNAPVPMENVAARLAHVGARRDAWDAIVSSGDIALAHIASQGYRRVFPIGPCDRDWASFEKIDREPSLDAADAILCTGFEDDDRETECYRPLLERALARRLPFVCANPDLVVDVGGKHYKCAGLIAGLYERMGGEVFWAGKPHASAYAAAQEAAERIRGEPVDQSRVLAIGDAVRTDIMGARRAGIDALFVASGIHRDEVVAGGVLSPERLAALFAPPAPPVIGAMIELAW